MKSIDKLQKELDEKKWLDSEKEGKDTCGKYAYCVFCNKDKQYPCAEAKNIYLKGKKKSKKTFNIDGKSVNYRATIVEK